MGEIAPTPGSSHAHDHAHQGHSHGWSIRSKASDRAGARRSLLLTLLLTVSIMIVEAVGGFISGSLALKADAGHMLTDASSLVLALAALYFAARPADPRRTYGYYRLEILAALANGVTLLVLAGFICWEAIERLRTPQPIGATTMLVVAAIGLAANVGGLLLLSRQQGSLNVRGAYLHVLGDALSSVGVLVAGVIVLFTGVTIVDPIVSIVISFVIVWSAWRLVREAVDVLLEAVPSHLDLGEVLHAMEGAASVSRVHDLHIWTISSGMHALSAHVVIDTCDLGRSDEILRGIRTLLNERFEIDHATIQIELPSHCEGPGRQAPCS